MRHTLVQGLGSRVACALLRHEFDTSVQTNAFCQLDIRALPDTILLLSFAVSLLRRYCLHVSMHS